MADGLQVTGQMPEAPQTQNVALQDLSQLLPQPQTQTAPQDAQTAQPTRDLSKEPSYIVHATHYGYPGDSTPDSNSANGIGAWNNKLTDGISIALTPDLEQRFGAKPGEDFVFTDRNGKQWPFKFGDRTDKNLRGRIDVYDRTGQIGDLGEGTISRPGAQGPSIPALETSNDEIRKQPAAFGMRVATPDDVKSYDTYVQNGGDVNQIPVYDRLAVAIAKDPTFLTKPENFEAFYGLVYKPLQAQSSVEKFNDAIMNIGPSFVSTLQNVGQAVVNSASLSKDEAELAFRKATGLVHDPGYETLTSRLATELSTTAQGAGQGIGDAWNFVTGVYNGLIQTSRPLAEMFTHDPQSKDQVDREYAKAMQQTVSGQQALAGLGNTLQDISANAYKVIGAADVGQKIQAAQPNQAAAQGFATLANPLNYLPELGAAREVVGAVKPIQFERGLQAAEELSGANGRKLVLDSTQILPQNPEVSAANPGYVETRNLQAQFAPAARAATEDVAQKTANLNDRLTSINKISGDPGTATALMSKAMQGTGATFEWASDLAQKTSEFPDWISHKLTGGNPVLQPLLKSVIDKTLFGTAFELAGPVGLAAEAVLEHVPKLSEATSDLFRTAGKELMYGQTTIPYWTRVAEQTKLMPKFLAAALDSPLVQTAGATMAGGAAGAATGAVLGGLQEAGSVPGGGPAGAVSGFAQGGIIGAAGGGLGQIQRFRDPNQYLLQARGDWKRYRDTLSTNKVIPMPDTSVPTVPKQITPPTRDAIAQRAFEISQQRQATNVPGSPAADWLQAERQLTAQSQAQLTAPAPSLLGSERDHFDRLSPTNQLILAQTAQHFPGLKINYVNDPTGAQGFHFFDSGGRSNIQINLANQDSVVRQIMAHELIHGATHSGMLPDLYDNLFGNPQTGAKGQYTALDAHGNPIGVNPATGRYYVNQEFNNLAAEYTNKMAQNGLPTAHLNDLAIAKEIYAEHGTDYLLSGAPILDANSAFRPVLANKNAIKTALIKMGYTFDDAGRMIGAPGGNVSGTGLFTDLQRNPALANLAQSYFRTTQREGMINSEEEPTHRFSQKDLQNPKVAETWLTNAAEIVRNQDGTAKRDPLTGQPIYRTPKEVEQYNAGFANAMRSGLEALSEEQRMDLGFRATQDEKGRQNTFVRYLPDHLIDSLALSNQYNPNQIASLRLLSRVLADKGQPGMEMRLFYHKALTAGKRYRGFEGTEKIAVPYGIEITGDNNVNIKSADFNQLANNYLRVRNREPFKSLWDSPDAFTQDAHTYFTNHANGRPGADAIGEQKRDAINSLANFGTVLQRETNPLIERTPGSVRPIIKSYRIDRANQISATGAVRPFISEEQYHMMNRNYMPGAPEVSYMPRARTQTLPEAAPKMVAGQDLGNDGHAEAIPATVGNPNAKDPVRKLDYGLTEAPLLGKSAIGATQDIAKEATPTAIPQSRMDTQFRYLNGAEQRRLQTLSKNGAVDKFANRIVKEFDKWKDNPDIRAGMGWYSRMRNRLAEVFGDDHEKFSQLLGATSARTPVDTNFLQAADAFQQWKAGKFDNHIREYLQSKGMREEGTMLQYALDNGHKLPIVDDDGNVTGYRDPTTQAEAQVAYLAAKDAIPRQSNGQKFNANSMQVLKVLANTWLDESKAPKTPNFAGNLSGRTLQATIDVWAARMLRRIGYEGKTGGEPWRILPKSEGGVSNLDFAFSQLAMERAASKLVDPTTGEAMNPDDLQAVAWFAEKHHWDNKGWTDTIGAKKASFDEIFHLMYGGKKPLSVAQAREKIAQFKAEKGYQ